MKFMLIVDLEQYGGGGPPLKIDEVRDAANFWLCDNEGNLQVCDITPMQGKVLEVHKA